MLWSLTKVLTFVALIAAVALGAGFLIENGGEIRLTVAATEITFTPLAAIVVAVLGLIVMWAIVRFSGLVGAVWRFLRGDETAISRYFDRSRERRGYEALAEGMMALASGEGRTALTKAEKAQKYLNRPELTLLLSAQAAEMTGDRTKALNYYKDLLGEDRTRFVGLQGILKQKLGEGDAVTALALAEKAFAIRPKHEGTLNTLFDLQSDKADWQGARKTLAAKLRAGQLPRDVHTRRDAVLALADAKAKAKAGDSAGADAAVIESNRLSPTLVPAAVLAAGVHQRQGSERNAGKVLRKAWETTPHPDLAAAYAALSPDETPAARQKRFVPLLKIKPEEPETVMLATELALTAEDFPEARRSLGDLPTTTPTTRSLTLMAAIEKGEGAEDHIVRGWLAKAVSASRGPQWVCASCRQAHAEWQPICESCGAFDTLDWTTPPLDAARAAAAPELPAVIVGLLEARPPAPETAPEPAPEPAPEAEAVPTEPAAPTASEAGKTKAGAAQPDPALDGVVDDAPVLPDAGPKT